jgi:hypothetical protein
MDEEDMLELMGFDDDDLDEILGDDDDDDDDDAIMGRRRRRGRRRGRRARGRRTVRRALVPKTPGVPTPGPRNWPLGFGLFTFVNAGVTTNLFTAAPQRPFKGVRLVVVVSRSAGATAELVSITSLNVGQTNQLVGALALPAEAFGPGAFQVDLALDPATPGIDITIGVSISAAPGVAETVSVNPVIIGLAIG